jgi:cytochrome P450
MTPEMHGAYAPKLRAAFSWNVVAATEPVIREAIRGELQKMAGDSRPDRGVPPAPYMRRAMFVAFARLVFGLAPGSEDLERFRSTWHALEAQNLALSLTPTTKTALADLRTLALQQIERLGAGNAPECVLGEWLHSVPGTPSRTVLDNLMFLFTIGVDNVSGLLRWVLKMLADHPGWGERVRAEGGPLAERIVMETLRLEQSEYLYRLVRSPLAIGDYRIPAGWRFRLCVRESHRDPTLFENPEAFDPDRFLEQPTHAAYSPFGAGRHACLAPHASQVAARILVEELAEGYDWRITADGPRQRPPRHWHHWEPSARFAVSLSPRR